jgi:hypothetical protein
VNKRSPTTIIFEECERFEGVEVEEVGDVLGFEMSMGVGRD